MFRGMSPKMMSPSTMFSFQSMCPPGQFVNQGQCVETGEMIGMN